VADLGGAAAACASRRQWSHRGVSGFVAGPSANGRTQGGPLGPFRYWDENKTFCVNDNARARARSASLFHAGPQGHAESEIHSMAGNLPVPLGLEMKLTWTFNAQDWALNILHFRNPAGAVVTQAIADAAATSVRGQFSTSGLAAVVHTGFALSKVEIRSMVANSDPWFLGAGAAVPGTSTDNPLPAATSLVVTEYTGLRGRSYKGRVYLTGFTEAANDTVGGATPATAGAAASFILGIMGALAGATPSLVLCVLSRFTTTPPATTPVERTPPLLTTVTQVAANQRWDVQRRRAVPGI